MGRSGWHPEPRASSAGEAILADRDIGLATEHVDDGGPRRRVLGEFFLGREGEEHERHTVRVRERLAVDTAFGDGSLCCQILEPDEFIHVLSISSRSWPWRPMGHGQAASLRRVGVQLVNRRLGTEPAAQVHARPARLLLSRALNLLTCR
jgi:hypothetical protein